MDMSSSDAKIEKKAYCSKSIHTLKQPYIL